jgi:hypothetical protein
MMMDIEKIKKLLERLKSSSSNHYLRMIDIARQDDSLGLTYKMEKGILKKENLDAMESVGREYGRHIGLHEACIAINELLNDPLNTPK